METEILSNDAKQVRTGKWRIEFCEGDEVLVRTYARLAQMFFNINPIVRTRGGWLEAYRCSRIVYEYLTFACEHPNGKKTGKLGIPEIASRSLATIRGFLCGLFSVEGSVKADRYVRLTMEMLEPKLIPAIRNQLSLMGLKPDAYEYPKGGNTMHGVYLYGPKDCTSFLNEIGLLDKRAQKLRKFLRS